VSVVLNEKWRKQGWPDMPVTVTHYVDSYANALGKTRGVTVWAIIRGAHGLDFYTLVPAEDDETERQVYEAEQRFYHWWPDAPVTFNVHRDRESLWEQTKGEEPALIPA
jgi:hypothetical protein